MRENDARLDMYGPDYNGRFAHDEAMIAEREIGDVVTLHQPIIGEEKEKAFLDSDVFIQTSRTEGMPVGILEALSYGLPCIVTEGTTMAATVNEAGAGWGCKTEPESVCKAIEDAIRNKAKLTDKSRNAIKISQEVFSWEKISSNTVKEYQRLK